MVLVVWFIRLWALRVVMVVLVFLLICGLLVWSGWCLVEVELLRISLVVLGLVGFSCGFMVGCCERPWILGGLVLLIWVRGVCCVLFLWVGVIRVLWVLGVFGWVCRWLMCLVAPRVSCWFSFGGFAVFYFCACR